MLIDITVSGESAVGSARVADAISAALVDTTPSLTPNGPSTARTRLAVVESARPSAATPGVNLLAFIDLGAAAGLLVALILLIVRSGRSKHPPGSWRPGGSAATRRTRLIARSRQIG